MKGLEAETARKLAGSEQGVRLDEFLKRLSRAAEGRYTHVRTPLPSALWLLPPAAGLLVVLSLVTPLSYAVASAISIAVGGAVWLLDMAVVDLKINGTITRIRAGRCAVCGYQLVPPAEVDESQVVAISTCPECGEAVIVARVGG